MARRPETTLEQMKCDAKRKHVSKRMAEASAEYCQAKAGIKINVYRCHHCKHWHLTKTVSRKRPPSDCANWGNR